MGRKIRELTRGQSGNGRGTDWIGLLAIIVVVLRIELLILPRIETRKTAHSPKMFSAQQSAKRFMYIFTAKIIEWWRSQGRLILQS